MKSKQTRFICIIQKKSTRRHYRREIGRAILGRVSDDDVPEPLALGLSAVWIARILRVEIPDYLDDFPGRSERCNGPASRPEAVGGLLWEGMSDQVSTSSFCIVVTHL
mgnify:CR=1 FL=1